jgi:hypothetical protein
LIAEACRQESVSRSLFNKAEKNRKGGMPLTIRQIKLLSRYGKLLREAEMAEKSLDTI